LGQELGPLPFLPQEERFMSASQPGDEFGKAKDEAKARFTEFRKSYGNAVQRAKEHGDALLTLAAKCQRAGKSFPVTLDELGIPRSTAYEHRKLAAIWPEAQAVIREGADAGKTIPEMIRLVDPGWKLPKEAQDRTTPTDGTKTAVSKSKAAAGGGPGEAEAGRPPTSRQVVRRPLPGRPQPPRRI
jgi:hypothetical protein